MHGSAEEKKEKFRLIQRSYSAAGNYVYDGELFPMHSQEDAGFNQSALMIEQRLFAAMLEYLLDVLILTVCFSVTVIKFNYLTQQHERVVQSIHSKRDLRERTERVAMEAIELLENMRGRSNLAKEIFDQVFERALVKLVAFGYIQEKRVVADERVKYEYSITDKGLEFYAREIKPIFAGFLRHIRAIDISLSEVKGLEKYT